MSEQIPSGRPPRSQLYQRLDTGVAELWDRLGGLPSPREADAIWEGIWFEEAHNSTAIEGNTLVLKQVEVLLSEGRAVGNKELAEYMEVKGYADAAQWVYQQAGEPVDKKLITQTELREIHRISMGPVWEVAPHPDATEKEHPGSFRQHDVHPFPKGMKPPSWTLVDSCVDSWVRKANKLSARTKDFAEDIAQVHAEFEQIHPFLDGNGRTGRLVTNLLLVRLGYPPAIIMNRERVKYLRGLQAADGGQPGLLAEIFARAILDNLHRFVIPAVAGPLKLVLLAALENKKVSAGALRVAAIRGRLEAVRQSDGTWKSTRQWVNEYLASKHKRNQ